MIKVDELTVDGLDAAIELLQQVRSSMWQFNLER